MVWRQTTPHPHCAPAYKRARASASCSVASQPAAREHSSQGPTTTEEAEDRLPPQLRSPS